MPSLGQLPLLWFAEGSEGVEAVALFPSGRHRKKLMNNEKEKKQKKKTMNYV